MFITNDIIEIAKLGPLNNLAVAKNNNALIKFVYLGVSELFRRFNLSIKVETIQTTPELALYELKNKDVSLMIGLYNSYQQEMRQTDTLGGIHDYKLINYRSFLLAHPKNDLLFALYKGTPAPITSLEDEIDLPDAMMDALITYVSYMGHSTINKDNINESSAYLKRFDSACMELENQGYKIPLISESINLRLKGFV